MMKNKIFCSFLFLMGVTTVLWAATATVTNNGNIPVRVQYKTPDGQYQDLGHVQPGETVNVPGGVEKVKIVREPGEWAAPLRPGEVLDVEVKEGDQVTGKMNWYGDKVFFGGLTEGLPSVTIGTVSSGNQIPQKPEPPKEEPATISSPQPSPQGGEGEGFQPSDQNNEPQTQQVPSPSGRGQGEGNLNWPWYGGIGDSIFFIQLFVMWPFLFFLWFRSWRQPGYYLDGEWVEGDELGWGWGWQGGGSCARFALMISFLFGLGLGGIALWGHANFVPGDGLVARFGQDLYSFPYFLFSQFGLGTGGGSELSFILLFWTLTCTSFGGLAGVIPLKGLYATPFFLALLPFFLFTRGCAGCLGPESFAYDGGYKGMQPYPGALASLFLLVILFAFVLDWFDPYYYESEENYEDVQRHKKEAWWDFLDGNSWPLLVFLTGGCLCCFYGEAYYYGWDYAIGSYFYDAPVSLGLNFIPAPLMIFLFWMILFGGLARSYYSDLSRFWFYLCLIPAFLVFLFLMTGDYPQRDFEYQKPFYYVPGTNTVIRTRLPEEPIVIPKTGRVIRAEPTLRRLVEPEDRFGDQVRSRNWGRATGGARNLMFQDGVRENRDRDNH